MNPMTNMKNVKKLSEQELHRSSKTSWHDQYRDSAWIFVGGLPYDLTEGDLICVFSQYGEIVNINLVRDKDTGKQKGFCFVCYEDQRSTVLAVDNLNGIKILGRTIRVDHVNDYKMPKDHKNADAETKKLQNEGCGPSVKPPPPSLPIPVTELPKFAKEEEAPPDGFRLPPRLPIGQIKIEKEDDETPAASTTKKTKSKKSKKSKKNKKKKSKKKHKKNHSSSDESSSSSDSSSSSEDDTSDSENETKKKRKTDEKQKDKNKNDPEKEIQVKIERPSMDRIKTEDTNNRKNKNEIKSESKNNDQQNYDQRYDNFKQNRREFDKYDNKRNYDRDNYRRYNDRENDRNKYDYRSFNNDRDKKNSNNRDDRKRYNDRRDNRDEDSKRHRR